MNVATAQQISSMENPFSTRFIRPGAITFIGSAEVDVAAIAARFAAAGRRGVIVGPHGSGKSTLLAALEPRLQASADGVIAHALHDGHRRMPRDFANRLTAGCVLIVDGYEQLSYWGRREVRRAVQRSGAGLLATSHAVIHGLPTLCVLRPTLELAQLLIARLVESPESFAFDRDELERLYEQCGGNLRELFFRLYDLYELRKP